MNDGSSGATTPLAESPDVSVELGPNGAFHVRIGIVTLQLTRELGEDLATTMARAVRKLRDVERPEPERPRRPELRLVRSEPEST